MTEKQIRLPVAVLAWRSWGKGAFTLEGRLWPETSGPLYAPEAYDMELVLTPKFTPGYYRQAGGDGRSIVHWYATPPWLGAWRSEAPEPEQWERVEVRKADG